MIRKLLQSKYLLLHFLSIFILLVILGYFIFRNDLAIWAYGDTASRNGELLKDFLSIIGGVLVIAGLYLSFIRARSFEKSVEKQDRQIDNQTKGIELTRTSLINDQFKNAVSHLGENKEPIIFGGIAELYEIAENNIQYRKLVCDILSSFIRSEAPVDKSSGQINDTLIAFTIEKLISKIFIDLTKNISRTNLTMISIEGMSFTNFCFDHSRFFSLVDSTKILDCSLNFCHVSVGSYNNVIFNNCDFLNIFLEDIKFEFCSFDHIIGSSIIDSQFNHCQIKGLIKGSLILFNSFNDSKFGYGDLEDIYTHIQSTNFSGSQFSNCDFYNAKIEENTFDICQIYEVNFKRYIGRNTMKGAYSIKMLDSSNKSILEKRFGKEAELNQLKVKKIFFLMFDTSIFDQKTANKLISEYNRMIESKSEMKFKKLRLM